MTDTVEIVAPFYGGPVGVADRIRRASRAAEAGGAVMAPAYGAGGIATVQQFDRTGGATVRVA